MSSQMLLLLLLMMEEFNGLIYFCGGLELFSISCGKRKGKWKKSREYDNDEKEGRQKGPELFMGRSRQRIFNKQK